MHTGSRCDSFILRCFYKHVVWTVSVGDFTLNCFHCDCLKYQRGQFQFVTYPMTLFGVFPLLRADCFSILSISIFNVFSSQFACCQLYQNVFPMTVGRVMVLLGFISISPEAVGDLKIFEFKSYYRENCKTNFTYILGSLSMKWAQILFYENITNSAFVSNLWTM